MSTETEALGQMVPPENTLQPGVAVGNNAEATSRAMVGIVAVDLIADADRVLLQTEYVCSVMVISDSGTVLTGPVDIEYPALFPRQTVTNNTAETLTLRMDGTTGIALAAGDTTTIVAGPDDVIETGGSGGGGGAGVTSVNGDTGPSVTLTASDMGITDSGGYFTGTNVEAALQELGAGGGSGGTNLGWFNVKTYGALGDGTTDDTVAIQDAIDAAETAGGGVVYFPAGVYIVGGALQDTGRSNAQILLPIIDAVDAEQVTIEFRGAFAPPCVFSVVGATPLPDGHSVIKGTLNTGTGALLGSHGPVGTFLTFTNVHFRCRDLAFRMPSNPVLTALNLSSVACVDLDNVIVDCGNYYIEGLTEPTTTTSYGIRMPSDGNGALSRLGTVNVVGFYSGYEFAEHCSGFACQAAWGCKRGFVFASAASHASYFDRLMSVHCTKGIVATGAHWVTIAQYNIEHLSAGWQATTYDIDDASNYLSGSVTWQVVLGGTGVDGTFTTNGAAKINMTRIGFANRIEQRSVSAAITFSGIHANKHIYHPTADTTARTWTIPSNASVPYPIGTTLTFVNDAGAGALTIAITTDDMALAGAGTSGSRTLAANGQATAVKMTATRWQINGVGLT